MFKNYNKVYIGGNIAFNLASCYKVFETSEAKLEDDLTKMNDGSNKTYSRKGTASFKVEYTPASWAALSLLQGTKTSLTFIDESQIGKAWDGTTGVAGHVWCPVLSDVILSISCSFPSNDVAYIEIKAEKSASANVSNMLEVKDITITA